MVAPKTIKELRVDPIGYEPIVDEKKGATNFFARQWQNLVAVVQQLRDAVNAIIIIEGDVTTIEADIARIDATTVTGVGALGGGGAIGSGNLQITHDASTVIPGSYTNTSITVDADGHVTAASSGSAPSSGLKSALIYRATSQSVATTTDTIASFSNVDYDDASFANLGTNPTRLTVPTGVSRVQVCAGFVWTGGGANEHYANIKKNGSFTYNGAGTVGQGNMITGAPRQQVITPPIAVSPGDYFELNVFRTSGAGDIAAGAWMAIVALA